MIILEPTLIDEHRFFYNQLLLDTFKNIDVQSIDVKPVVMNLKKVKQLISA